MGFWFYYFWVSCKVEGYGGEYEVELSCLLYNGQRVEICREIKRKYSFLEYIFSDFYLFIIFYYRYSMDLFDN